MFAHTSFDRYSDWHVLGLLLCAGVIALCCAVLCCAVLSCDRGTAAGCRCSTTTYSYMCTAGLIVLCCTGLGRIWCPTSSLVWYVKMKAALWVRTYQKRLVTTSWNSTARAWGTSARLGSLCGGRVVNRGHVSSELGVGTHAPQPSQVGSELDLAWWLIVRTGGVNCMNTIIFAFQLSQWAAATLRSQPQKMVKSSWRSSAS